MANASPNAFGAQLAFPGRQTIALCGDGGFTMLGLGDLLTEVQRNAPVITPPGGAPGRGRRSRERVRALSGPPRAVGRAVPGTLR